VARRPTLPLRREHPPGPLRQRRPSEGSWSRQRGGDRAQRRL